MKKTILLIMLFISSLSFAQTGVNTKNPQTIFHVDGNNDNPEVGAPSTLQQANDFVVTSTGKVGIGTDSPTVKLEINSAKSGALKITDGTQQNGNVLISDANGTGIWKAATVTTITGVCPLVSTPYGVLSDKYMGGYIELPQGQWFVYLGFLVNGASEGNKRYASRLTFSSSTTVKENVGFDFINKNSSVLKIITNGPVAHKGGFGMFCSGIVRINVTTPILKLYLWDVNSRVYSSNTGSLSLNKNAENYLFAIRAD